MHELRLALQVDAALQVDVLGSAEEVEELHPLARSRPVDRGPEQLEVVVVEHEVPRIFFAHTYVKQLVHIHWRACM